MVQMQCALVFVYLTLHTCISRDRPPAQNGVNKDQEGRVKMGESNFLCDDGIHGIGVDFDNSSVEPYTCFAPTLSPHKMEPLEECEIDEKFPHHKCLQEEILYEETVPTSGAHRPLWPKYGEYLYCPPQRWLHSLEHGAAVFLYHPCADTAGITLLKEIANSCLYRHVITPYKQLDEQTPFAIVTWRCRLLMSYVNTQAAKDYLKRHAILDGREKVSTDGQYNFTLISHAEVVSTIDDVTVCPEQKPMLEIVALEEEMLAIEKEHFNNEEKLLASEKEHWEEEENQF